MFSREYVMSFFGVHKWEREEYSKKITNYTVYLHFIELPCVAFNDYYIIAIIYSYNYYTSCLHKRLSKINCELTFECIILSQGE